jgi:hypothetical protein
MPSKSLAIWNQALSFHFNNWKTLLPVFPLLCLPVAGDVLHSLLICQKVQGKGLLPMQAVREVWRNLLPLFSMKLYFEGAVVLWSFIPIYGIIKGIRHRLHWAMASNVLVFENLSGEAGRKRCRELIQEAFSLGVRTLVTVPSLLFVGFILVWVIGGMFFETYYSYGFAVLIATTFWMIIPASDAVNTFLYLKIQKDLNSSAQTGCHP